MKIVKIGLFNDRKITMHVRIDDFSDLIGDTIEPAQYKEFSVRIPKGRILYFKIWENNTAFLSHMKVQK